MAEDTVQPDDKIKQETLQVFKENYDNNIAQLDIEKLKKGE